MTSVASSRTAATTTPLTAYLPDMVLGLALLISALRFVLPVAWLTDVHLYDESYYLGYGLALLRNGPPTPDWAPLYAVWYFGWSLIIPDGVALYLFNFVLICTLLPLVLYVTLRCYAVAPWLAALVAFFFLIAHANVLVWPRVSHFALLIILLSLCAARLAHTQISAFAIASFGALLAAFVRPDVALAAILLFVATLISLVRLPAERAVVSRPLLGGLAVGALGLLALFGSPFGDGSRSFDAFAQHFSLNWVAWTGSDLSPWTDAFTIIGLTFGDVESIAGALRANPGLVIQHIASNLGRMPQALFDLFFRHANLLLPQEQQTLAAWLLFAAGGMGVLAASWRMRTTLLVQARAHWALWIMLGAYLPGLLAANLLIYPRGHYLLMLGTLLLVGMLALFARPRPPAHLPASALLAVLLLILTPNTTALVPPALDRVNITTINTITALDLAAPVFMLEAEGGYNIYIGAHVQRVPEYDKDRPFAAWAAERQINMIVVSDRLRNDSRLRDDPEWLALLADPAAHGYVAFPIEATGRLLLVDARLLPPE